MASLPTQERQRRPLQRQPPFISGGGGIKARMVSARVRARFPNNCHRTSGTLFFFLAIAGRVENVGFLSTSLFSLYLIDNGGGASSVLPQNTNRHVMASRAVMGNMEKEKKEAFEFRKRSWAPAHWQFRN